AAFFPAQPIGHFNSHGRTAYGQSGAQWPSPNTLSPATATAAAAPRRSRPLHRVQRRRPQLPLVPTPGAGVGFGVGNGWRLVRFWPWRLESFPIDSGKPNFSSLAIERARSRTRSCILKVREAWNVWREYPQWIFSKFISFSSCSANSLLASTVSRV
uniref:Uncharacterized protein n=1 Tax=Oryza meridionalis TaxID=40149 RepID=A0A0E0F3W2_9ORYZ